MKRLIFATIAALFIFTVICVDAKFDAHITYFKPIDAGDIDVGYHDTMIKDIQKYYQSEMTRHGYTDKTFPLELDEEGKLVIHIVNAKHNGDYYKNAPNMFEELNNELPFRFNNQQNVESRDNVHLIIVGGIDMNGDWRGGPAGGFTWLAGRWGANAIETMDRMNDFPNHYIAVVAHELDHAFGLDLGHNNVPESFNGTIIAWGKTTVEWGDRMRILDFEAALLDSRPIFRVIDLQEVPEPQNKNEDLGMGTDDEVEKDKGDPIFVTPYKKLTITWGSLKRRS